jgi:hypothetical protein
MKFNWGHGILTFIIIFLILSIAFIIFSLNQSADLVSDDYYDQGADYSKQIEINKRSFIYRDSISVKKTDTSIQVILCKSLMNTGDTLNIHFYRPSDKKADLKLRFSMTDNIIIPSKELKSGRYVVKISWKHQGEIYNIDKELFIK